VSRRLVPARSGVSGDSSAIWLGRSLSVDSDQNTHRREPTLQATAAGWLRPSVRRTNPYALARQAAITNQY
jgi:hypothetical protein